MEMSFIQQDDILTLSEKLIAAVCKEVLGLSLATPFPRLTYQEAMDRYGTDKPDRRFGLELQNLNEVARQVEFKVFRDTVENGGLVAGLVVRWSPDYSKSDRPLNRSSQRFWCQRISLGEICRRLET